MGAQRGRERKRGEQSFGGHPRPQLDALTGLRFVAAAHILLLHFGTETVAGGPATLQLE